MSMYLHTCPCTINPSKNKTIFHHEKNQRGLTVPSGLYFFILPELYYQCVSTLKAKLLHLAAIPITWVHYYHAGDMHFSADPPPE